MFNILTMLPHFAQDEEFLKAFEGSKPEQAVAMAKTPRIRRQSKLMEAVITAGNSVNLKPRHRRASLIMEHTDTVQKLNDFDLKSVAPGGESGRPETCAELGPRHDAGKPAMEETTPPHALP